MLILYMSHRKAPNTPVPEVYKDIVSTNATSDSTEANHIEYALPLPPVITHNQQFNIPSATLHGSKNNLKRIKSFKKLRQSYKVSNQKSIFMADMQTILSHLNTKDNKLNLELLIEISNIANEFFIYGDKTAREKSKAEAVHELLLPYFLNDADILETMLISAQDKIIKSNVGKRILKRVTNFFYSMVKVY
jgi:hypothetical protein